VTSTVASERVWFRHIRQFVGLPSYAAPMEQGLVAEVHKESATTAALLSGPLLRILALLSASSNRYAAPRQHPEHPRQDDQRPGRRAGMRFCRDEPKWRVPYSQCGRPSRQGRRYPAEGRCCVLAGLVHKGAPALVKPLSANTDRRLWPEWRCYNSLNKARSTSTTPSRPSCQS
jgi:hypothetical protein